MRVSELVRGLPDAVCNCEGDVLDIVSDSRQVREGSLFVCIRGARFDGHDAAEGALAAGACAVVCERDLGLDRQILVPDTRYALARLCSQFFGRPQDKLRMIAVTGTNGKTTIANLLKKSLEKMGRRTGLIGTNGNEIGEVKLPAKFTTPEPWDLEMLLARMVRTGCEFCVMEASSQALDQGRLADIRYECGIFTNLSRDHLDYHKNFENYLNAKKLLFTISYRAVVNWDDPAGREVIEGLEIPCERFSLKDPSAEVYGTDLEPSISGVRYRVRRNGEEGTLDLKLPGEFSASNGLACAGALLGLGFPMEDVCAALSSVNGVDGRCEVLHDGEFTVISDYAHTPDAIIKLLGSLKPFTKGRLIALFGCAGLRDKTKREPMARAVAELADYVVFSSDNPRNEEPFSIMQPLLHVAEERHLPYALVPDRYWAIEWMMRRLEPGDVFVLLCKGHEDYQVIDGTTVYLDERRMVREHFRSAGHGEE